MLATPSPVEIGLQLTDELEAEIFSVVQSCHYGDVTVSSTYARLHSALVAAAASEGLITTWHHAKGYGRTWRATSTGLSFLEGGAL